MDYSGSAFLCTADGEFPVSVSFSVRLVGGLTEWTGAYTSETPIPSSAGSATLRLPNGRSSDVLVTQSRAFGKEGNLRGSGPPPAP